jgi:hypothetical protein
MYYFLTEATKRRMILELRRYWSYHPRYKDIVEYIQGKYAFDQRVPYGIVVKSSSANQVQLSSDNFQGTVESYCYKMGYKDLPGLSVEWVREDSLAIQENRGVFPSPPGIYFMEVLERQGHTPPYSTQPQFEFIVEPLYEVKDESLLKENAFTWHTGNPFLPGGIRVFQMPGSIELLPIINYTANPEEGSITLVSPVGPKDWLSADYYYPGETTGPWNIQENFAHRSAIPGVVLAFGRRVEAGDKLAVVVHDYRQPTALEYGGKWEINLDFDIVAQDVQSQQEIADQTLMYLWGVARNRLSTEGIEITNVSMGGESEEVRDETGDDYYYMASISVTMLTDWSIHVPLERVITAVTPQTAAQRRLAAGLTDEQLANTNPALLTSFHTMESLGLRWVQDPYFSGQVPSYEVIR